MIDLAASVGKLTRYPAKKCALQYQNFRPLRPPETPSTDPLNVLPNVIRKDSLYLYRAKVIRWESELGLSLLFLDGELIVWKKERAV